MSLEQELKLSDAFFEKCDTIFVARFLILNAGSRSATQERIKAI